MKKEVLITGAVTLVAVIGGLFIYDFIAPKLKGK